MIVNIFLWWKWGLPSMFYWDLCLVWPSWYCTDWIDQLILMVHMKIKILQLTITKTLTEWLIYKHKFQHKTVLCLMPNIKYLWQQLKWDKIICKVKYSQPLHHLAGNHNPVRKGCKIMNNSLLFIILPHFTLNNEHFLSFVMMLQCNLL